MKLSRKQLIRIIREEKQKLMETDFSSMGEDEILDRLSPEEYEALEVLVYVIAEEVYGKTDLTADDAGYCIAVLLQQVFPLLKNPTIQRLIP